MGHGKRLGCRMSAGLQWRFMVKPGNGLASLRFFSAVSTFATLESCGAGSVVLVPAKSGPWERIAAYEEIADLTHQQGARELDQRRAAFIRGERRRCIECGAPRALDPFAVCFECSAKPFAAHGQRRRPSMV